MRLEVERGISRGQARVAEYASRHRLKLAFAQLLLLLALLFAASVANAASVSASPASLAPGGTLNVAWSAIATPTSKDWVGVYTPGAPDTAYQEWRYTNGQPSGSGPLNLAAGKAPGTYEIRLYANDGYTRLATGNNFTVAAAASASLSVNPTSIAAGGTGSITWGGIASPSAGDWIALYLAGAPDHGEIGRHSTNGAASGSMPFGLSPALLSGTYQMRLFSGSGTRLAVSNTFSVTAAASAVTLSASPTSIAPGGAVSASWSGIATPSASDWIGLYTPGATDNTPITRRYTSGTASGTVPFTLPPVLAPGTYQLRLFANDGYTRLATSNTITVGAASAGIFFIHTDHLNTPRVITNHAGQTVWQWDNLDPFGHNAPLENPSGLGTFTCNLRLPGQYFDRETNLHYNYFRDYDPGIGRYIQSDPIGLAGGINTYAYVGGNPVSRSDPTGLLGPAIGICIVNPAACATVVVGGAVALGGLLSSKMSKSKKKKSEDATTVLCPPPQDDCNEEFRKCNESGWGGKVGFDSACTACFRRCQGTGYWPTSVTSGIWGQLEVSCEYWLRNLPGRP